MTHFSPRYKDDENNSMSIANIENEAKRYYQQQLYLAKDFDSYRLNKSGSLVKITETSEPECQ
jgi:ribonuclease Z